MQDSSQRRRKILAGAGIAAFALAMAVGVAVLAKPMKDFLADPGAFRDWVNARGAGGRAAFLGLMILQIVLAFLPGEPLEICAGAAFGVVEGTALCMLGAGVGSLLVFAFVRKLGVKAVEVFFSREKIAQMRWVRDAKRTTIWMSVLFLIPGTPKDLLAYLAGLTRIRVGHWMLISTVARFPSIVTSTIGGNALGEQSYWVAAAVFAGTLLLSGLGVLVYRRICKRHEAA